MQTISNNRKAHYDYQIIEEIEAGIVLKGTEVKSLRFNKANITSSYAFEQNGEFWVSDMHIPQYKAANMNNHDPKRIRKLLLHKRQISKIIGTLKIKGLSLIILSVFFNSNNIAKIKLGLGKGKKKYDKRETIKQRDWQRSKQREFFK